LHEEAVRRVDIHEPALRPGGVVVLGGVPAGVGDVDEPVEVLDPERRVSAREGRVGEAARGQRDRLEAGAVPLPTGVVTVKPVVGLNTWPVGLGPSPVDARPPGMLTVNGLGVTALPLTSPGWSVATPVPLSETHSGVITVEVPEARPHGLTRLGSTSWAPWFD
jgi:hypothetical protein